MAELGAVLGGRYRLDQVLGQGGMATIFRATDAKLGREVAVKVLRPEFGTDAEFVERFRHEARAAASLSHPNIVQVYDYGADPAGPYIVMEQVAGGDLAAVLGERGPLPPTAVARTGQQVADALSAAHAAGLVHRDIKPSNVLLSPDGRVQVADFGIAQAAARSPVTVTGISVGSVLYFSPEQARGDAATAASDVYALGLVMYEMLTGQRAFSGDSPAAVAIARLSGSIPSPMAVRADVPPSLDAIVRRCLAPDPSNRPSAAELSAALARFVADPSGASAYASAVGPALAPGTTGPGLPPGSGPPVHPAGLTSGAGGLPDSERSGSGPWAWMAAGLGLLVIVATGILLFLLFSGIGEEAATPSPSPTPTVEMVATPRFVGRREGPAQRLAAQAGLVLEPDYVETDEEDPGRIIDQLPEPGVEIAVGTSVQVTIATQAETVVIPDVSGYNEAKAIQLLEAAGFVAGNRHTVGNPLPEGYVVATDPRAGVSMTRGSVVDYIVSTGVVGETAGPPPASAQPTRSPRRSPAATSTARATPSRAPTSTATPSTTKEPTATVTPRPSTAGSPTATSPAPTSAASITPEATMSPSPFPSHELTLVGDYNCLDLATARGQLAEAGLLVGAIIPADPPPDENWIIHDQLPKAGESVPVGSAVDLVLMDPLEPCPAG